jgi:hypothetical protein
MIITHLPAAPGLSSVVRRLAQDRARWEGAVRFDPRAAVVVAVERAGADW